MNLVLFTGISPYRLPPPRLAAEQVTCGAGLDDVILGDRIVSLRTPRGGFEVAAVLQRLSRAQQPDAVAVLVDSRSVHWPRGLARFPGPEGPAPRRGDPDGRLRGGARRVPADRSVRPSDPAFGAGGRGVAPARGREESRVAARLDVSHSDAEVEPVPAPGRQNRIAVSCRAGVDERRLLGEAGALARQGLPVYPRMLGEREVPAHFASSRLALVAHADGGFDLRLFQALATGAATLCPRPPEDSGWKSVWPEPVFSVFDRPEQLSEQANHFLAQPQEARALGAKAARWFAEHLGARHRQLVFSALVLDNQVPAEFVLPTAPAPRRAAPQIPAAAPAPDSAANRARGRRESGARVGALELAQATLRENDASWPSALVLAEVALEAGKVDLARRMLAKVRALAPEDEQLARVELGSPVFLRECRGAATVAQAWQAWENRDLLAAIKLGNQALLRDNGNAAGFSVAAHASFLLARQEKQWMQYGHALNIFRLATEASPRRADLWHDLAVAQRIAGGALPDAVTAFRKALALDPERPEDWFGLGEALLALGDADGAAAAFGEALGRAPQSLGIANWLGHARKRQGRLSEARACHQRALGAAGNALPATAGLRPGLRRAVFVLQNGHGWPCWSSVHREFVRDPGWETVVVGLPWLHPSFANSGHKDQDKVFDFLAQQQFPHVKWTDFPLAEKAADLVFLQNPYDSTRPEGWKVPDLIGAGHRLCYVPYGIELGSSLEGLEYQFDMQLHRYAWAVFARSEPHRTLFAQHCLTGNRHVAVTGHPKFDDLGRSHGVEPDPELVAFARGRPLVLWNPQFDARQNRTRFGDGYSTFLRWRDFIPQEFARHPELAFVLRPHPNFFSVLEERGLMTPVQQAQFLAQCAEAGIFVHRSPAYFPALAAVDAMISDGSSLLIEFGISGKPVCYLHNPNGQMAHLDYELDFDFVRQHCHWATEEAQIRAFLDGLGGALADHSGRELRAAELRRRMGVGSEPVGLRIKREIEGRLLGEEAPLAPPASIGRL